MNELYSSIGRIEGQLTVITNINQKVNDMDMRLRTLETTVGRIEAVQPQKTPWWSAVGGVAGIGSIILALIVIAPILSK